MSFDSQETSVDSGKPIELLLISYMTNVWCYTTSERQDVYDGKTYIPAPMQHDALKSSGEVAKTTLTVSISQDCPVSEMFRIQPPSGVVSVTLFTKHADDAEAKAFWKGRIINVEWEPPWLKLTVENVHSSLKRMGLRRKYSSQCPHALYGQGLGLCNVNRDDHKVIYTVGAVSGTSVSSASLTAHADQFFAGGYVEWIHATTGYKEMRMILSSYADGHLVLSSVPVGLVPGAALTIYPGCDHLSTTCDTKFGNSENYGGMEFIPKKNPFGGTTLY